MYFNGSTNGALLWYDGNGSSFYLVTTQLFRDFSAWYHIVAVADTTNGTQGDRIRLYVNGTRVTAFATANYPSSSGYVTGANQSGTTATISKSTGGFNGYMTEINFIDGQALTPSSFGETNETTGVWSPIRYAGSYGTNGFYLPFSDNSGTTSTTLGADSSGNGNNWTPNNFSVTAGAGNDSLVDSPTRYGTDTGAGGEVRGNYATLNAVDNALTLANGNLQFDRATTSWASTRATFGVTSGKWYWEVTPTAASGTLYCMVGVALNSATLSNYFATSATGWAYSAHDGGKYNNATYSAYGATWTTNDVIGVAFDADAGTLTFYKNNVSQGTAYTGLTSGPYIPAVSLYGTMTAYINFGQRPFAYAAPTGFKTLCTTNLPTPTIIDSSEYFDTVLYTGNSVSGRQITGVGFQPDFVWTKGRNDANPWHNLFDVIRGGGKTLFTNSTAAEVSNNNYGYLSGFNSDGFTLTQGNIAISQVNDAAYTYVAWNWKADGAGVSNGDGTISSTVSVSTTSGFSIVTYTGNGSAGTTVGHGLGVAPKMIIAKTRNNLGDWPVYHVSLGNTKNLLLNTTGAESTSSSWWNNTTPSSTVITLGNNSYINGNTYTFVAYCFADVEGFSKFGSYTGNGSADGPFVYTGFRPAFVMIKGTSAGYIWTIEDNKRDTFNPETKYLQPQASAAEGTFTTQDFTSNGFKIRTADTAWNGSGITYIYMAFAESPFKFALGR
jgi:hypothetical protein